MAEVEIAVGDRVRVHFHPPKPLRSYSEGVVRRVDVATPQGRVFVVEVAYEVLLDREHRIRPGFQDHVLYESQNDFLGRIEVLSDSGQDLEGEPVQAPSTLEPVQAPVLMERPREEPEQEVWKQPPFEEGVHAEAQVELTSKAEANSEPSRADLEHHEPRRHGGLFARLFERQE